MRRDRTTNQLDLFGQAPEAASRPERFNLVMRVRLSMGSDEFENFTWWCQKGNRAMCEAVLWTRRILSVSDAGLAVREIGGPA